MADENPDNVLEKLWEAYKEASDFLYESEAKADRANKVRKNLGLSDWPEVESSTKVEKIVSSV